MIQRQACRFRKIQPRCKRNPEMPSLPNSLTHCMVKRCSVSRHNGGTIFLKINAFDIRFSATGGRVPENDRVGHPSRITALHLIAQKEWERQSAGRLQISNDKLCQIQPECHMKNRAIRPKTMRKQRNPAKNRKIHCLLLRKRANLLLLNAPNRLVVHQLHRIGNN